ncbi:AAA family ATPase [Streptomyces atroolivaceus]|uniref:AAA family ATPase n=1 Tax=Streptomyces atroolivaceus TaxID=66869 RepID=UPI0033D9FC32
MLFNTVASYGAADLEDLGPGEAVLVRDNWDDYGFKTTFDLYCHNGAYAIYVGEVKIGHRGMQAGRVTFPEGTTHLADEYFSLGVDESYYAKLRDEFEEETRLTILHSLRDVAYDTVLLDLIENERVMADSLLRGTDIDTVRGQFNRIANGGPTRSKFHVRYRQESLAENCPDLHLDLKVDPDAKPPSNIHALIGSNGVGKTRLLHSIAHVTLSRRSKSSGGHLADMAERRVHPFNNVVYVSFSAFDAKSPHRTRHQEVGYQYVGLQTEKGHKDPRALAAEFADCVESCLTTNRATAERWRRVLKRLEETDTAFCDLEVIQLGKLMDGQSPHAKLMFSSFSSGHAIVLLTLARIVLHTTERTLVLIDEPEAHLHPPLLSTFVRILSEILADRNGVAIVATHSPVVLQETPRDAVWALRRSGEDMRANHPEIETFGENIGVITREIFGLEVRRTGFNRMIQDLARQGMSFDEILDEFDDRLGAEGRALARSATRRRGGEV